MHAVDTNVVVRLLVGDDAAQSKRAASLFRTESILISTSVALETEWVLRSLYRFERTRIVHNLRKLAGLENVEFENPLAITSALRWCEEGLDFADALHLASSEGADTFATFDAQMKRTAPRGSSPPIRLL